MENATADKTASGIDTNPSFRQSSAKRIASFLVTLVPFVAFGCLIGYLSGLSTQPLLALLATTATAVVSMALAILGAGGNDMKPPLFGKVAYYPQKSPLLFAIACLAFCLSCYSGVHAGIAARYVPRSDVSAEVTKYSSNIEGADRLLCVLLLKEMHAQGFSVAERQFVLSDLGLTVGSDIRFSEDEYVQMRLDNALVASRDVGNGPTESRLYQLQYAVQEFLKGLDTAKHRRLENMLQLLSKAEGIPETQQVFLTRKSVPSE